MLVFFLRSKTEKTKTKRSIGCGLVGHNQLCIKRHVCNIYHHPHICRPFAIIRSSCDLAPNFWDFFFVRAIANLEIG